MLSVGVVLILMVACFLSGGAFGVYACSQHTGEFLIGLVLLCASAVLLAFALNQEGLLLAMGGV